MSHVAVVHSLSLLYSITLHYLLTINFPILLFMDIWLASVWELL